MTTPAPEPLPRSFGKYTLLTLFAKGGTGRLFLSVGGAAPDPSTVVVTKLFNSEVASGPFKALLEREAGLHVKLEHPNIVTTHELGHVGGEFYQVMEYVAGKDVQKLLTKCFQMKSKVPANICLQITIQVLRGLAHAHRVGGVVHRDLRPSNVVVGYDGTVRLIDFGLAKTAIKLDPAHPRAMFNTSYMSPEQARGGAPNVRSDVYAAGIVLYEMLTGTRLFTFSANDRAGLMRTVTEPKVAPPSKKAPEVTPEVDAIVLRALARDPVARFQSAEEFAQAATKLLESQGTAADGAQQVGGFMQTLFAKEMAAEHKFIADLVSKDYAKLEQDLRLSQVFAPPPGARAEAQRAAERARMSTPVPVLPARDSGRAAAAAAAAAHPPAAPAAPHPPPVHAPAAAPTPVAAPTPMASLPIVEPTREVPAVSAPLPGPAAAAAPPAPAPAPHAAAVHAPAPAPARAPAPVAAPTPPPRPAAAPVAARTPPPRPAVAPAPVAPAPLAAAAAPAKKGGMGVYVIAGAVLAALGGGAFWYVQYGPGALVETAAPRTAVTTVAPATVAPGTTAPATTAPATAATTGEPGTAGGTADATGAPGTGEPATAAATAAPATAAPRKIVKVRLDGAPAGAMVFLDGENVGELPYKAEFEEGTELSFTVSAVGYDDQTVKLTVTGPVAKARVMLHRTKPASAAPGTARPATARPATAAPPPETSAPPATSAPETAKPTAAPSTSKPATAKPTAAPATGEDDIIED